MSRARATQAVVLARGLGSRMRAGGGVSLDASQERAADAGAKGMMPINGRPLLDFILSALADAGMDRIVLVVAPDHAALRSHFEAAAPSRFELAYAAQAEPRGTADAVLAARDAVRDAPFLVLNGDNYYSPASLLDAAGIGDNGLVAFEAEALVQLSGLEAQRVLRYALIDMDGDALRDIREKPAADDPLALAAERWVSMNLWSFTPAMFDACASVQPSPRGELELQSAVHHAMRDRGLAFRVIRRRDAVLDLTHRGDVVLVQQRLGAITPQL